MATATRQGAFAATAVQGLIERLPLGVLAGVLPWVWLRERAPRHPESGPAAEV